MKFLRICVPLAGAICLGATLASAQAGPDVFFGVGTAIAPSSGQLIDTFGTGSPYTTPRLGGTFGKAGADFMLNPYLGIGGEADFRFSQGAYTGLSYRPTFYDFNAIWTPTARRFKRIVPEFQAGVGGVHIGFNESNSFSNPFTGTSTSSFSVGSSNHFQVHLEAGVRFYVTPHIFIRPQVDAHWVNNLFQFGSDWVPEYGGSVGWSFGEH